MSVLSEIAGVLECDVLGEDRPGYYDILGSTRAAIVRTEERNVVFSEQEQTFPSRDVYMC